MARTTSATQVNDVPPNNPPPYYSRSEVPPQPVVEYAIIVYRPGAGYRFLSSFFVATMIWVLFGMLVRSSLYVLYPGKWHAYQVGVSLPIGGEYSVPQGIHLDQCIQGRDWKSSNTSKTVSGVGDSEGWVWGVTTYDLPVSAESLLVISRGRDLTGTVEIETSPHQSKDHAAVRVLMSSSSEDILERTKACLIKRREDEHGVGIFTPTTWPTAAPPRIQGSHYRIVVILPEFKDPSTLFIRNFETDVPNNAHIVQDLGTKAFFDRISLNGSNGFVSVKTLRANVVNIGTTSNDISGNFHATKELSLATTYANILADVNLTNREGWNSTLNVNTHGGHIRARVNLFSAALSPSSYSINANNTGGGVQLVFPQSIPEFPSPPELHVKVTTLRGLAAVTIPPMYEGSFDLRTEYGKPVLNVNPDVEDPFGLGRKRRLSYASVETGQVAGYVDWAQSGPPRGKGTICLTSSTPHYLTGVQLYG